MTQSNKKNILFATDVLLLTLIAIILRTLAIFKDFDFTIGYYDHGAILPVIFNSLCTASAIGIVAFTLFAIPKEEKKAPMKNKTCRAFALLPVAAFACLAWDKWQKLVPLFEAELGTKLFMPVLSVLLCVAALVFFVAVCVGLEPSPLVAISGTLTFFLFITEIVRTYSDMTVTMNSPNKTLSCFAFLSAMLFVLAEMKTLWGISKSNRLYTISLMLTVLFTGAYSLPNIISAFFLQALTPDLITDLMIASLFLLASARLITLFLSTKEEAIEESAEAEETEETEAEIETKAETEAEAEEKADPTE